MTPRPATEADFAATALLWQAGWREAHLEHTPEALTRLRTLADFDRRLRAYGDNLRLCGPTGAPLGFCAIKGNLLDQLFVSPKARGTGMAAMLLADGAARIKAAGHPEAELDCIPENLRAIAFYEKQGWRNCGIQPADLDTSAGQFQLDCIIFRKML